MENYRNRYVSIALYLARRQTDTTRRSPEPELRAENSVYIQENRRSRKPPVKLPINSREGLEDEWVQFLPNEALFNEILARFVDYVHPQLPFMDMKQICGNLRMKALAGGFSLFVLHAMIAAAWPHLEAEFVVAAGFASAKEASNNHVQRATVRESFPLYLGVVLLPPWSPALVRYFGLTNSKHLMDLNYETDAKNLIQGLLFLSTCAKTDPSGRPNNGSVWFLKEAISKAKAAKMHREGGSHSGELSLNEKRLRRRLWWCCYVQDRLSNLLTGRRPCIRDKEVEIAPLSLEDFDFHHIASSNAQSYPALPRDTLSQIFLVYLFKLKVELLSYVSRSSSEIIISKERICEHMDKWYQNLIESVSSQAVSTFAFKCLMTHWESLVLLHQTIRFLSTRARWAEELARTRQTGRAPPQGRCSTSPSFAERELQHSLRSHTRLLLQLQNRGQLLQIAQSGLWALLPAMVTIIQVLASKENNDDDIDIRAYREIYLQYLSILESHRRRLEAVESVMPFVERMLQKIPQQCRSDATTPVSHSYCDSTGPVATTTIDLDQLSGPPWKNSMVEIDDTFCDSLSSPAVSDGQFGAAIAVEKQSPPDFPLTEDAGDVRTNAVTSWFLRSDSINTEVLGCENYNWPVTREDAACS
ncbi:uncharacterized protein Z519_05676 [Cladophialophora bantiana CBS 173.52]|uniref:Xylanolytic transcriptional activator regulatory domain-containing protein n=1 Tax=Cladophialophora bantiana (strain ATCC 10958 / CBS 173.52 / CDC B-1940 / NIH 8579) TaxID=1442370 RepID=A0A0D2ET60_CLAB1|nr:uncharacterized protein Z519_05676 [Cladophialophora bantiana CBS 173.52]KIW93071.1 hypothetical protein Z519_05676 [Cladophialophora bantiana CBS 173.52]